MGLRLTLGQAKALDLLSKVPEMDLSHFSHDMWPYGVADNYARYFLGKLIKDGYAEQHSTDVFRATAAGKAAAASPEWFCESCKTGFFRLRKCPEARACRSCPKTHYLCRRCVKGEIVLVGEFPNWQKALRRCPVPKAAAIPRKKKTDVFAQKKDDNSPDIW